MVRKNMENVIETIKKLQTYAKAIVASVGSILVAVVSLGDDLGVSFLAPEAQKAVAFVLVALTAFSTWAIPNYDSEEE